MAATNLQHIFSQLSQGSSGAVQNGQSFTALDKYLHVKRPIESRLLQKMKEIDAAEGGIVMLIGWAGDGKSHLISKVRTELDWDSSCYYNDATASCSPEMTAIDTLKHSLTAFNDYNIEHTHKKLLLAINEGKLSAFIDDIQETGAPFNTLAEAAKYIFDKEGARTPRDSEKIKFVLFSQEQLFEFYPDCEGKYPVKSEFLNTLLERIVAQDRENPFYMAYLKDKDSMDNAEDPLLLNYELLMLPAVRDTIVKLTIEAIIRDNLHITAREFLGFISSIMIFPEQGEMNKDFDFYDSLLPSLLYGGGHNALHKTISRLDPLKTSNKEHDKLLSLLFSSHTIPNQIADKLASHPEALLSKILKLYSNNGRNVEPTSKLVFRLLHLSDYHSESPTYEGYLKVLAGVFGKRVETWDKLYELVDLCIPRHCGSYHQMTNMIPLTIQGGLYKLFVPLELKPQEVETSFTPDAPSKFALSFNLKWHRNDESVFLKMDYKLYSYLVELDKGKLAIAFENERNLVFSAFIRDLSKLCSGKESITIVNTNKSANTRVLSEKSFGRLQLQ